MTINSFALAQKFGMPPAYFYREQNIVQLMAWLDIAETQNTIEQELMRQMTEGA